MELDKLIHMEEKIHNGQDSFEKEHEGSGLIKINKAIVNNVVCY